MDFKDFKKNRSKLAENIEKLRDEKESNKEFGKDNYFPKPDEMGNAYSVIRILPQKDINKFPLQLNYSHRSTIGNKYLSLVCPSTFGTMKDCDLCQVAASEWARRKEAGEDKPKVDAYRDKKVLCNILVVKDDNQPELVGKVMKFYIPFPLQEKLNYKLMPPKNKEGILIKQPEMVHDLWEGKNLVIEIRRDKRNYNDYSESHFEAESTPVAKTETEIEAIYNQLFDLELDRTKIVDSLVEEWDKFHKLNDAETLEDKKKEVESKIKHQEEAKKADIEETKKAEDKFSVDDVADESQSADADDEALPW